MIAFAHQLQRLGPAGDHLIDLEGGGQSRRSSVKHPAVDQGAGVIDLHRVGDRRPLAEAVLDDPELQSIGPDDHARLLGVGGQKGRVGLLAEAGISRGRARRQAALAVKGHAKTDTARNAAENFISSLQNGRNLARAGPRRNREFA